MIIPIGLSLKCAEDPVPEVSEVGINCIEMLKKIILDGGFLVMGNHTLQDFNEKAKQFPKYGARFRDFIRTAITLGKIHHVDSFPKLSNYNRSFNEKLGPCEFIIVNKNELEGWGIEEGQTEVNLHKSKVLLTQYLLLQNSSLREELDKRKNIPDMGVFNRGMSRFFDYYKWPFTNFKKLDFIDTYIGQDVYDSKQNEKDKSGLENLLIYLSQVRKLPLDCLRIYTSYDNNEPKPDPRWERGNAYEIINQLTKMLYYYSDIFKKAEIYLLNKKSTCKKIISGVKKKVKLPHGRYIGMTGKRESDFCLYIEKGASGIQDKISQRQGTTAHLVNRSDYVKQVKQYEEVWKANRFTKDRRFKYIKIEFEANCSSFRMIENGFVINKEISEI